MASVIDYMADRFQWSEEARVRYTLPSCQTSSEIL